MLSCKHSNNWPSFQVGFAEHECAAGEAHLFWPRIKTGLWKKPPDTEYSEHLECQDS